MPRSLIRVDHIYNGQAHGDVADRLVDSDLDISVLRPWRGRNGKSFITVNGRNYAYNAPATLTKEAWLDLDQDLIEVARPELRVWGDLQNAGLRYNVPDGFGTPVIQEQTITDWGTSTISMDALRESERSRPLLDIRNFPLPIIHGDFSFSAREIAVSRRGRVPLDTTSAKQVTRRMMEQIELMCLGTAPSYSYGGGTIYGLTNKPQRLTKTMTLPTDVNWTPNVFVDEILDMIDDLQDIEFNGPYGLYYSKAWGKYFDQDYADTYGGETLRTRLAKVEDVNFMRKIRYGLTGYQVILFQLSEAVIRAVTGMKLTTLQWDGKGGLSKYFKVMCIMVPQIRTNADSETGINHGVAA